MTPVTFRPHRGTLVCVMLVLAGAVGWDLSAAGGGARPPAQLAIDVAVPAPMPPSVPPSGPATVAGRPCPIDSSIAEIVEPPQGPRLARR